MERNAIIDIAKYVAAILVVAIHTRPLKVLAPNLDFFFVDILCRFAVPFFAVCTGFYISSMGEQQNNFLSVSKRSLCKIVQLYIFWSLVYLVFLTYGWIRSGANITCFFYIGWVQGMVLSFSFYHLWYLISICYGLCLFMLIKHFVQEKWFIPITIALWLIQVFSYAYDDYFHLLPAVIKESINFFLSLFNGLTLMLPLLLVGNLINKYALYLNDTYIKIGLFISILGLIIEVYFLKWIGIGRWSFVLFTLPCAFFTFVTLYRMGQTWNKSWYFSKNLASVSLMVYCLHPMVIGILGYNDIRDPVVVFFLSSIISTIISLTYILIKYKIKKL